MARPEVGPPPVATSVVARAEPGSERKDLATWQLISESFRREDRRQEMLAMFGGNEELAGRFLAVALHALSQDSDLLMNASVTSIIQAVKDSAAMGLEPTGLNGEGWIIRYKSQAVFQPGWRGYLKRIRNSGKVEDIDVQVVYEYDDFDWGWSERGGWFRHTPVKMAKDKETKIWSGRGDYAYAYAYARMPSGFVEMDVMSVVDINAVRDQFSPSVKAGQPSPWDTSWSEMARKTVIRRLAKRLPQSAVDLLLIADEKIEALRAAEDAGPRISISEARRAAIAGSRRPLSQIGTGKADVDEQAATDEPPAEEPSSAEPPPPDAAEGHEPNHQDDDGNPTFPGHREPVAGVDAIPFDDEESR